MPLVGAVCSGTRFEGMVFGRVRKDGWNATREIVRLLEGGKFLPQLHLVLLDGIAFGGFNVVDLEARGRVEGLAPLVGSRHHLLEGLLALGGVLAVIAAIGLHRFSDVFARMHAATKPATLGLVVVLGGAVLVMPDVGDSAKLILVILLQLITAPVGAHLVGRAAYLTGTELDPDTQFDEMSTSFKPERQ